MAMKGDAVIMGDFNMPDVKWNLSNAFKNRSRNMLETLKGASLKQMSKMPNKRHIFQGF